MKAKITEIGVDDAFYTLQSVVDKCIGQIGTVLELETSVFNGEDGNYDWKYVVIRFDDLDEEFTFAQVKLEMIDEISNSLLSN